MQINTPRLILIHSTDYPRRIIANQFNSCNEWHKARDFPLSLLGNYIGYHRLITGEKNYQAREDNEVGAHCNKVYQGKSVNFQSLGVCIGFDGDIEPVTDIEYNLLQKQVWEWQDKYNIPNNRVVFHRFFVKEKTCPGSLLNDAWLARLLLRPIEPTEVAKVEPRIGCLSEGEKTTFINLLKKLFT